MERGSAGETASLSPSACHATTTEGERRKARRFLLSSFVPFLSPFFARGHRQTDHDRRRSRSGARALTALTCPVEAASILHPPDLVRTAAVHARPPSSLFVRTGGEAGGGRLRWKQGGGRGRRREAVTGGTPRFLGEVDEGGNDERKGSPSDHLCPFLATQKLISRL